MRMFPLVGAGLALSLALSGCAALQNRPQSGVEACATIADSMKGWSGDIFTAANKGATDPATAAESAEKVLASVKAARAKVTNAEVGAALDKMDAAGQSMATSLEAAKGKSGQVDEAKVTAATKDLRAALDELGTACTKL